VRTRLVRLFLACVAALFVLVPAGAGAGPPAEVNIEFSDYRPAQLDVLPGETVNWTNVSLRVHTVTSDTGLFDSGEVAEGGHFAFQFTDAGAYAYHCIIHPSITGEVDVRRVILGLLPTAVVPAGTPVELDGRVADTTRPVSIQRRLEGADFTTVGTTTPAADGTWKTKLSAEITADYRALSGTDASQTRRLLVSSRHVVVRPTRTGVHVTVTPSAPYARFLVEILSRERFGWYPVASGLADYVSEADVRIKGPARVRIVLVDKDGWTPLATSRVVVLPKR
jgi:plastocyanin